MKRFWILPLLLLASACTKKTDVFVFDCTVYDDKLAAPVANATVVMKVQRIDNGFNPNFETIGTATTDAQGRFVIEVDKEVFYSIKLDVSHPEHFSTRFDIDPDDVPFSTAYQEKLVLEPKCWLATHLVNQNQALSVTIANNGETADCVDCCPESSTIAFPPSDTTVYCMLYAGQQVLITGNYTDSNGAPHPIVQTVTTDPLDTTVVTVLF
jgi:hypothetical protein